MGFFQLINAPTRGHNLIDLLLTTNEYLISNITVTDDDSVCLKSDHKAITADINVNIKVKKQAKRTVDNYAKDDFNSLRDTLRCLPLLEIIDSEHDVDTVRLGQSGKVYSLQQLTPTSRKVLLSLLTGLPTLRRI